MGSSAGRTFDEDQLLSIKETRAYLDAGNFSRVFDKYKAMKETHHMFGLSFPVAGGNVSLVQTPPARLEVDGI